MGMIRVSDEMEQKLKQLADGRSMTATIDLLFKMANSNADDSVRGAGGYSLLQEHIDKRFDELKALIEDTTIDRLDAAPRTSKTSKVYFLPWENCIQDIYDDFPEGSDVWLSGVREAWGEADSMDMASYFTKNGEIWSNFYGHETPLLRITPELSEYLHDKGFEV